MEQSKLAKILNAIIILGILSIIFYTILIRQTKNIFVSVMITAMIISVTATEIKFISTKRNNRLNLKAQELKHKESCIWKLILAPKNDVSKFFKKLLSKFTLNKQIKGVLFNEEAAFAPYFDKLTLESDDIIQISKIAKINKVKKLFIFCAEVSEIKEVLAKITNLEITVLDGYETYGLMKSKNIFPVDASAEPLQKIKQHLNFSLILTKNNAKPFLICGFWLFLTCFFTPYKLYYCIFAAISLIIALIIMFFIKKAPQTSKFEELIK